MSVDIGFMVGKVFSKVYAEVMSDFGDVLVFENEVERFTFWHSQDCCEDVFIESIVGDLSDLVGLTIRVAERVVSPDENPPEVTPPEYQESFTWTFYKFATIAGYVTVRWYGESNGYYGEDVDLKYETLLH